MNDTGMDIIEAQLDRIEAGQLALQGQIRNLVKERNALRDALVDLEFIFEGQEWYKRLGADEVGIRAV